MINLLICAEQSLGDKLAEAGIVVLIGVSMVFLLLFLLIGVVKLLQYLNGWLNSWDKMMAIYRADKAERKAVKQSYIDARDEQINLLYKRLEGGEIQKAEFKQLMAKIKQEYNQKKPEIKQAVIALKAEQKQARLPMPITETAPAAPQTEQVVTDAKLVAIITAAIAVATEQEQAERKVAFKVRSIKHIN